MALNDPIAAYNAASNLEAHLVCGVLIEAGIPAMVIEDMSQVGAWIGGLVPEVHKPQVWIERTDIDRAKPVLDDYERRAAERRAASAGAAAETIAVTCEECGKPSKFSAAQKGTVQSCPHCEAYIDVCDEADFDGWDEVADEQDEG